MPVAYFRELEEGDLESVSSRMRELDIRELQAVTPGEKPIDSLLKAVGVSNEVYTLIITGKPEAIFGLANHKEGAVCWLLCTEEIASARLSLIRKGRDWVKSKAEQYGCLFNYVLGDHVQAHRFIEQLGFKFTNKAKINGEDFLRFEKRTVCAE